MAHCVVSGIMSILHVRKRPKYVTKLVMAEKGAHGSLYITYLKYDCDTLGRQSEQTERSYDLSMAIHMGMFG